MTQLGFVDACGTGEVPRISAYVYNSDEDVLRLFEALDESTTTLGIRNRGGGH